MPTKSKHFKFIVVQLSMLFFRKYFESRKFLIRFSLQQRPPEGIYFHWRGLKNRYNNIKLYAGSFTFHWRNSDILPGWGFKITLEGFTGEFINPSSPAQSFKL